MDKNEPWKEYMSHRGPGPDDPGLQGEPGESGVVQWFNVESDVMLEIMWKSVSKEPLMKREEKNEYMIHYSCPTCSNHLLCSDGYKGSGIKTNYCPDCGQKLDWSKIPNYKWL
ncbi:hypothetical protein [Lacrimispora sp.]|uniref:hypothetical protein n=1 Tax=Lacrimispora sp. TaxID=2719234 RepID=UPI0028A8E8D7|nr:hypothetical protein [Lacrimispora sp.]